MNTLSNFRFSEEASDDIRLCIVADDSTFGAPVVAVELPLDVPSDRDDALPRVAAIVSALNNPHALAGIVADLRATYEALKTGRPVVSIGAWGRLATAESIVAETATGGATAKG
jgi:hypothetical protein